MASSPRRPLTGPRLNYEIQMGGEIYQVRIKESIGNWLDLKPMRPKTGVFGEKQGEGGRRIIPHPSTKNMGKRYLKRPAGFEFQSFKFLVRPGTTIVEPEPGCHEGRNRKRLICSFSIGFSKGTKKNPITRWRINSWLSNSSRAKDIIGFVTPSGVKHQWEGKMSKGTTIPGGITVPPPTIPGAFGDFIGDFLSDPNNIIQGARIIGGLLY